MKIMIKIILVVIYFNLSLYSGWAGKEQILAGNLEAGILLYVLLPVGAILGILFNSTSKIITPKEEKMTNRKGFPLWYNRSVGFDDASIVVEKCRKIADYVPPGQPQVKEGLCLVIVTKNSQGKLIGIALCGPQAFEMYSGAVLETGLKCEIYEVSREFLEKHGNIKKEEKNGN